MTRFVGKHPKAREGRNMRRGMRSCMRSCMRRWMRILGCTIVILAMPGCSGTSWRQDESKIQDALKQIDARHKNAPQDSATTIDIDSKISETADLPTLIQLALERSPQLRETQARIRATLEEAAGASSLDNPRLQFETLEVPWSKPVALGSARTNQLGVMQDIPYPGKLDARARASLKDAESMYQMYREREREIVKRVKKTYVTYATLVKELSINMEVTKLLQEFELIAEEKYKTGKVSQQDVLKPQVELVMLHNEVIFIEQKILAAKAELNALLYRTGDAPMGKPVELEPPDEKFDLEDLKSKAAVTRPEILAAEARVNSSRAMLEFAELEAGKPDFTVGFDYMQMPGEEENGWGGLVGINLPWFTDKRSAEARRMKQTVAADEMAIRNVRNETEFQIRDAFLRVVATKKSLVLFKGELLNKSSQTVEVSRFEYEKAKSSLLDFLDAERSLRNIRIGYYRAIGEYETAVADLERAVGLDLRAKQ